MKLIDALSRKKIIDVKITNRINGEIIVETDKNIVTILPKTNDIYYTYYVHRNPLAGHTVFDAKTTFKTLYGTHICTICINCAKYISICCDDPIVLDVSSTNKKRYLKTIKQVKSLFTKGERK